MSNGHGIDLEKMDTREDHVSHEEKLRNIMTNTMTLSPELFEQLYLSPQGRVAGDLRKTFANPTPVGVLGFSLALFPLSIELMGLRGSGGAFGTQTTAASIFFGGALLWIAAIGEFILGNTFPTIVFFTYGAHYFTYGCTFIPWFAAISTASGGNAYEVTAIFASGFAFYALAMAMLSFIFLLGALRVNVVFVGVFLCATIGFCLAAAANWAGAVGNTVSSGKLSVATGALFFVADLLGWYLGLAQIIAIMELPLPGLPVGDLSTVIKAKSRGKVA